MFRERDKVRLASGEQGEIAVIDGQIARVWINGGLDVVSVAVGVLTPLEIAAPAPVVLPPTESASALAPTSINRRPGVFSKSVQTTFNPIFQEFLRRLAAIGVVAQPTFPDKAISDVRATCDNRFQADKIVDAIGGAWSLPETDIRLHAPYILTWCGIAKLEEPVKDWAQIAAIWKAL